VAVRGVHDADAVQVDAELLGHGVNYVTGDYSRGAAGFWVENGVIQYPVHEITIAGNLKTMFKGIEAVGADAYAYGAKTVGSVLINRMKVEGFIVSEHMEVWPDALKELGMLVGTGKLRPRETVAQGIAAAPEAFLGLLKGKNFGKQLVKLI